MVTDDRGPAGEASPGRKAFAWSVHAFTAAGVVLALLALDAIQQERWTLAMLWLLLALAIDGVDGTLARAAHTKTVLPRIDGEALDLVIDYLNYVLIPALLLWRAGVLPHGWELELSALILLSSLYVFVRRDMKTDDGYFRGFPGVWNVVALYLFLLRPEPAITAAAILLLSAASFAPVHFVHPFRVTDHRPLLLALSAAWAVATLGLLVTGGSGSAGAALLAVSLATAAALVALGLLRSLRGSQGAPLR